MPISKPTIDKELDQLTSDPVRQVDFEPIPPHCLKLAEQLKGSRFERASFFDDAIFGEPAWDMLISLYVAHAKGYVMKVSDVCNEAQSPTTTAIRWADHLLSKGYASKRRNDQDARSSFIEISPLGVQRLNQYFDRISKMVAS